MENQNIMQQVVENKIKAKLAKGYNNVQDATKRLIEEGKVAKDFIFEVGAERKGIESAINFRPDNHGKVTANFKMPESRDNYFVNPHAVRQVAEKLRIPMAYLTSLLYSNESWQQTW